jgi:hypothetical protein
LDRAGRRQARRGDRSVTRKHSIHRAITSHELVRAILLVLPLLIFAHDMAMATHEAGAIVPTAKHAGHASHEHVGTTHHAAVDHERPEQKTSCHAQACPELGECTFVRALMPSQASPERVAVRSAFSWSITEKHLASSLSGGCHVQWATSGRDILATIHILII